MSIRSFRKAVVGAAVIGAAAVGGAFAATAITSGSGSASSADEAFSLQAVEDDTNTSVAGDTSDTGTDDRPSGPHSNNGITEEPLTGDTLAQATAAAEAAVPGATVDRAETDADGAAYEVHMTKDDGSHVTVKLNADFTVAEIEEGHGRGHGRHGHRGGKDCDDEAATESSSTDSSGSDDTTQSTTAA